MLEGKGAEDNIVRLQQGSRQELCLKEGESPERHKERIDKSIQSMGNNIAWLTKEIGQHDEKLRMEREELATLKLELAGSAPRLDVMERMKDAREKIEELEHVRAGLMQQKGGLEERRTDFIRYRRTLDAKSPDA